MQKENRLELVAPELSSRLECATSLELRTVALISCHFVLDRVNLAYPVIDQTMEALNAGRYDDPQLRKELSQLVNSLDQIQWDIRDLMDEGKAEQADYLVAFQRARAANSLYYALDRDAFISATETIYEASAATNEIDRLSALVLDVLNKK